MKSGLFGLIPTQALALRLTSLDRWVGLVLRAPKIVTVEDCRKQTSRAKRLREQAAPMIGRRIRRAIWTRQWPGTAGPLVLHLTLENPFPGLAAWADVMKAKAGLWQDLQIFDQHGLLGFAITHEKMCYARKGVTAYELATEFKDHEADGTELAVEVLTYLFTPEAS